VTHKPFMSNVTSVTRNMCVSRHRFFLKRECDTHMLVHDHDTFICNGYEAATCTVDMQWDSNVALMTCTGDAHSCVWLICMCDVCNALVHMCDVGDIGDTHMCDIVDATRSGAMDIEFDSFIFVTWHSYVCINHQIWLIHMCHSYVPWLIHMQCQECASPTSHIWVMRHRVKYHMKHDSFICAMTHSYVAWPIHMQCQEYASPMSHICVTHMSHICVTHMSHICVMSHGTQINESWHTYEWVMHAANDWCVTLTNS